MQLLTTEFKNLLKQIFICSWRGHKKSSWFEVWWAIGHSAGYRVKVCLVCNKELETTKKKYDLYNPKSNKRKSIS
jgi:hypothetical protein